MRRSLQSGNVYLPSFGDRVRLIRTRELVRAPCLPLDCRAMDRRLARRNLRTALIVSVIGLLMFALTFVAALLYDGV